MARESSARGSEGRLAHIEPCGRLFQPKPGQVNGGADHGNEELITWVLESVVVTLLLIGRGGIGGGVLLLQDVGVDGVEVGTQPAGGGTRQRHHANLNKLLINAADTSGKRPVAKGQRRRSY